MRLCNAGSAGLSLLTADSPNTICWRVVTGGLVAHEGRKMPRDRSPCGVCVDANAPINLADPERLFPELKYTYPWVTQIVAVPLYDAGKAPLGALWLAQHCGSSPFSDEQCHIAQRLAMPLVRTIKVLELVEQQANTLRTAGDDLERERRCRELAERAYRESQRALEFKDAEIREAHHRVKNTLQIATTVLQLQARATPLSQVRAALRDGQDRLRSLAAVHELLQADVGGVQAVAMPKLLGSVVDALRQSFAEHSGYVRVELDADPVLLATAAAMPLALIANEAITNAYKHAFKDARPGQLKVILRRLGDNGLVLQVGDDGAGMQVGSGGQCALGLGLGLSFIKAFALQLGGVISLSAPAQGRGTVMKVSIENLASRVQSLG
jgi:two-component sensor histidine kinase